MRVLFGCSMGGSGHLMPLLDVANAFTRHGHEAVLLVPPSMAEAASAAQLRVVVGAQPPKDVVDEVWERVRQGPPEHVHGLIDRELFAGRATDMMRSAARDACVEFSPDLVVREPCEYASAMAAHEAGIPQVQVGISAARIEDAVLANVADRLDGRCAGVADAIRSAPYLTAFPAPMDPSPWQDTRRYRPPRVEASPLPDWWPSLRDRPFVYVTFGSVLGGIEEAQSVYRTARDAVADLPVKVLMTVGRRFDPATLGPAPDNTRVERWVPQADALARAHLVVCHGGSGTTNGVLAAGLPLVVCPLFADQLANAAAIERLGAGVVVHSRTRPRGGVGSLDREDAPVLSAAILSCLRDPEPRRAAQQIQAAMQAELTLYETVRDLIA